MSSQTPAAHDYKKSIFEGMKSINDAYAADPALHTGQKPSRAYVYCSDSRNPIEQIVGVGPGKVFGYRNIGNSLEQQGEPGTLSQDAINWLTYAAHIGVREFIILGHGNCGCINNAYACNCVEDHGHGHGHGMEADILGTMGKSKKFATDLVKAEDAADYLTKLGLPLGATPAATHVKAITIAHAFYQQKLAQDFLNKLTNGAVEVKVEYFELEATPCGMWAYDANDKKFCNLAQKGKDSECCGGSSSCCCRG
ncbi:MAG: carbonic anhydrase [Alphaproteobacteria bacterium]|nr:carbonic anhydrase [Alphaproteobacteria bacterium]